MSKVFIRAAFLSATILVLLIICVGLLVIVLKGQSYYNSQMEETVYSYLVGKTTTSIAITEEQTTSWPTIQSPVDFTKDAGLPEKNEDKTSAPWENFRLSKHVVPSHYDLIVLPDLKIGTFKGSVNITLNASQETDIFTIHSHKLNISNSKVYALENFAEIPIKRKFSYDPNEFFVIQTAEKVWRGRYMLSLQFTGNLTGSIVGFYRSLYTLKSTNETRYMAASKFEPTYARRAFPCFDEPAFKATFSISLIHEPQYIALSNMPVKETVSYEENSELLVTKFEKSVPMPTYLACFIVCDFDYTSTIISGDREFRVYATKDQVNDTKFALEFGSKVLEYYEDYFDIDFPLPKQDMIAVPDFVSGAMEHWGIITYRETNLLYNPEKANPIYKQGIASVISHEMVHMWFGDLVTMEWWDDLWLNEGFASYIEYKGMAAQYPEWDMMEQFISSDLQGVMLADSKMSSRAIVLSVSHPDEITSIFDTISYQKGASILRMLEFFIGEENFRNGLSKFLKKYRYGNARTEDMWAELSTAVKSEDNFNISKIMRGWTHQMGFPYISVRRDRYNTTRFTAQQRRFFKNPKLYDQPYDKYTWSIPLSYLTAKGDIGIIWLHDDKIKTFDLPVSESDWVKFNVNQTGYYIVNYNEEEWNRLIQILKANHQVFSPTDRANLLFDAFLLADAGFIKYDILLSAYMYLKNETHLVPWRSANIGLAEISSLLESTDADSLMKNLIIELTENIYNKIGWDDTGSHMDGLLRYSLIRFACYNGNQNCLDKTTTMLYNWTQGYEIPNAIRAIVYRYGMSTAGKEKEWKYMWQKYLQETSSREKMDLLYGLAQIKNPTYIYRYLDYVMNETLVRRQNFVSALAFLTGNPVARPYLWNFYRNKWPILVERFSLNDRSLGSLIWTLSSDFTTTRQLEEMKNFFKKYPDAGAGKRKRQEALERAENNINWLTSYKDNVKAWLQEQGPSPWYHYRLPPHIIPLHYDIFLHPQIETMSFSGRTVIKIKVKKTSKTIILHSKNMNITQAEVFDSSYSDKLPINKFVYEKNDFYVLQFSEKLPMGKYELNLEFEGKLQNITSNGIFFKSHIHPGTKEKKYIIATQFKPAHARTAFPCFDEPSFKSTFSLRLTHNVTETVISNTEEEGTMDLGNGLRETRFEKTVPMVTYLVCFVIGELNYQELYNEDGIKIRVYAAPHAIHRTEYVLNIGAKLLTFFGQYFNIPYPLKKLDMVAIPKFHGAMENWGIVTYEEDILFYDEDFSSDEVKSTTASFVAHELAYQWFGNLVTMQWWDDTWLNEGFASYMSYIGVKHVEPEWNYEENILMFSQYTALIADSSSKSHPIVRHVAGKPSQMSEAFDYIPYRKVASILRMLENLMGEEFRTGVSAYLKKHQYGNTQTQDLWNEFTLASKWGLNITSLMDTWTRQMNFPYLSVKRNKEKNVVTIQQHHFLLDSENADSVTPSAYRYEWVIPVTYYTASDTSKPTTIILNSTEELVLNMTLVEWIKLNANFTGYYLVNYTEEDWKRFARILEEDHTVLSSYDRGNLLFEAFTLSRAGYLSYHVPLNLTKYLKYENEVLPWTFMRNMIKYIKEQLDDSLTHEIAKEHVRNLSKSLYRKLTWNDTGSYKERKLRKLIIEIACENGNYECLQDASSLLKKWHEGESLSPNLEELVYSYGTELIGDESVWRHMLAVFKHEQSVEQKIKLSKGLANIRNKALLKELMTVTARDNNTSITETDYLRLLMYIAEQPIGRPLIIDLINRNWTSLVKRFTEKNYFLRLLVTVVYGSLHTEEDLEQVQNFCRKYLDSKYMKQIRKKILESIKNNIKWQKNYKNDVVLWFSHHVHMPTKDFRLPLHINPLTYDIKLHTNITADFFTGEVNIVINVTKPSNYIILHSDGLTITQTVVFSSIPGINTTIDEVHPFKMHQFWVIYFVEKIPAGIYNMFFKYSGSILQSQGLVKTLYFEGETKEEKHLLYTQFEPTYARRTFPCFDEPGFKATFKLTVLHDINYFAISNMPEENRKNFSNGFAKTSFMESVPMSTYLVCFVISDYDYTETELEQGKPLRFYIQRSRLNYTLHTLSVVPDMLKRYEEYFDIPYALPKLDFVAIPNFIVSGMENWGIIFLSDSYLGDDSQKLKLKMHADKVVAHELAHQWFGNLVTMKWWNDLWLNEGFSSFAMHLYLKDFHLDADELPVKYKIEVMKKDACHQSHPIVHTVSNPEEISSLFDRISYTKGGAILSMLQLVMKDDFRTGVVNYLKKYAYGNAETKDLWEELSKASKQDVNITEIMNTWTFQMGFPVIKISRNERSFTATQQRFFGVCENNVENPISSPYNYTWKVPLIYKNIGTGEEGSYWLNSGKANFPINASHDDCIKFNPDFSGYYIVKYDHHDYALLTKQLKTNYTKFSIIDRFNLLFDVFQLVKSDLLLYDVAFEISEYLEEETELIPWKTAYREFFAYVNKHLTRFSETERLWKKYLIKLSNKTYERLFENDTDGSSFKEMIQNMACINNTKCHQKEYENLQKWISGQNISNKWQTIKIAVSAYGNESLWEYMWTEFRNPNISWDDRQLLAFGISYFKDEHLIAKTLSIVITDRSIETSFFYDIVYRMSLNRYAMKYLWNFIKADVDQFFERAGANFGSLMKSICDQFKTLEELGNVIRFFKYRPHINSDIQSKCIYRIQKNIEWREKYEEVINSWLQWNVAD